MRQHIPNSLTATNLFCGIVALICVVEGYVDIALVAIGIGLVMDVMDGFVARRLGVASPVGKELDSLADMITFGAVPATMAMRMIWVGLDEMSVFEMDKLMGMQGLSLIGLLIGVFSGVRLAKFNLDTRQEDTFIGLPTPANTLLIGSCWLLVQPEYGSASPEWLRNPYFWMGLSVLSSYLLVSPIRLLSLKFKDFSWGANRYRYILIGLTVGLCIGLRFLAIPVVLLCYIALSLWAFGPGKAKDASS